MPVLSPSTYKAPFGFKNCHIQAIYSNRFRRVRPLDYKRERMELSDGDFIDLDWCLNNASRLVLLLHGLEGHSKRNYMYGMARAFLTRGWDAVAMNMRGCSGEPNRLLRLYHHGVSDDLDAVLTHIINKNLYKTIVIIGFSLGGNVTMKYLGEGRYPIPSQVHCAVGISVPCDIEGCAWKLAAPHNRFYQRYFFKMLRIKIREKMSRFPGKIDDTGFDTIKNFKEYDDRYTAPLHGFKNAEDYWRTTACGQYLDSIKVPSLIINAADDPFLSDASFPFKQAERNHTLCLEVPDHGSHVCFTTFGCNGEYWHELRVVSFVNEMSN